MPNTIAFKRNETTIVVTPVPGSLRAGGGHDDRGGGTIPSVRAGYAMNGSCQVVGRKVYHFSSLAPLVNQPLLPLAGCS